MEPTREEPATSAGGSETIEETIVGGRYRLGRKIADGGMSAVHEGEHLVTHAKVALKIASVDAEDAAEVRERMLREARTLAAIRHDHVVAIHDAGELEDGRVYLALELLDGRALDTIVSSRGALPPGVVAWIGAQMAEALFATHVTGVLHRDVKPANAMVVRRPDGEEIVKVFDYGIAALASRPRRPVAPRLTHRDVLIGTPEYIAPERIDGDMADDERADIYSLGVTLYELLTGDVPFHGSYSEILVAAATVGAPSLVDRGVPPELAAVVARAMAHSPKARFPSARALARALEPLVGEVPAPLLPSPVADLDGSEVEELPDDEPRPPPLPGARRRFPRATFHAQVVIVHGSGETRGRAEDLSEGGMLVTAPRTFARDLSAHVRFRPPGMERDVELPAAVRWSKEGRRRAAFGVEFAALPEDVRRAIVKFVAKAKPAKH